MSEPRWRVPAESVFQWREWDDEFVIYHVNSGDTHRLNQVGAQALRLLQTSSMSAAELAMQLAGESRQPGVDLTAARMRDLLGHLADLGLLELDDTRHAGSHGAR